MERTSAATEGEKEKEKQNGKAVLDINDMSDAKESTGMYKEHINDNQIS